MKQPWLEAFKQKEQKPLDEAIFLDQIQKINPNQRKEKILTNKFL